MKPAKKKPAKKSSKSKSRGVAPPKKKADSRTGTKVPRAARPVRIKAKQSENGTLHKIKTENLRLTGQLKQKNRELEIEAALERVRARTMTMHESTEILEVAHIMYEQLQLLGFRYGANTIIIMDPKTNDMEWWIAGFEEGKFPACYTVNYFDHPVNNQMLENWKSDRAFTVVPVAGDLKKSYDKQLFTNGFKALPERVKAWMLQRDDVVFSMAFMKHGALHWGPDPLSEEQVLVLQRFAKTFEQTYTRFLDLQKAETQAREAQVEAALEKIRSRSLDMHQSEELKEVVAALFEKLKELGLVFDGGAGVKIFNEGSKDSVLWVAAPDVMSSPSRVNLPYVEDIFLKNPMLVDTWQARETCTDLFNRTYSFEEKNEYFNYVFANNDYSGIPQPVREWIMQTQSYTGSEAYEKNTGVVISSYSGELITEKQFEILKRFSRVFEQAYIRFLDLQKAEEQAREAQIEAALERVRSRTMAMQHSSELAETSFLLAKQVRSLGIKAFGCAFNIFDEDQKGSTEWFSNEEGYQPTYKIPREGIFLRYYEAAQRGESLHVEEIAGEACAAHYRYLSTLPVLGDIIRKYAESSAVPTFQIDHVAYFKYGYLLFVTYEPVPEAYEIFKRFAKVFEQTYTRFLDLQKAEAQAREAQIEAALERVRSRTMAMHKSDELAEVAGLLFKQVSELGIKTWTTGFNVWSEDNNSYTDYITSPQGNVIKAYTIDATRFPVFKEVSDAKKRGDEFWVQYLDGELLKETYKELTKFGDADQYDKMLEDGFEFPSRQYDHFVFGSRVSLMFITYEPVPESHEIFKRFGKVFEQSYTRFLDLQKAEAQARESQIQLALERVRARTMAMQKSDELREVVAVVFNQMQSIGFNLTLCNILLFDTATLEADYWLSISEQELLPKSYHVPYFDHPFYQYQLNTWKIAKPFEEFELSGELKTSWDNIIMTQTDVKNIADPIKDMMRRMDKLIVSSAAINNGLLQIIGSEPLSEEKISVLQRFANVFEQTYTRFLDLQRAEAQAREAQIEAALERVRSRTMAMQRSEELADVATMLFQQIRDLGIKTWTTGFNVWLNDDTAYQDFVTNPNGGFIKPYIIDLTQFPTFIEIREAKLRGDHFYVRYEEGDTIKETYQQLMSYAPEQYGKLLEEGFQFPVHQYEHFVFGKTVSLMFITYEPVPEAHDIFKRFGKVFEQTYTRFLDLQTAETQARETQIQLALERVRARTMAMQKSNELADAAQLLYQQFRTLDISNLVCGYIFIQEEKNIQRSWAVLPDGTLMHDFIDFPLTGDRILNDRYQAWKDKVPLHKAVIEGKENKEHHQFLAARVPAHVATDIFAHVPDKIIFYSANFSQGYLHILASESYTKDEEAVVIRFAKVFEQTYTRFLDLQKAEAQSREAQIEVSLERVRGKAMAMHSSEDLAATIGIFYRELESFSITPRRCGVGLLEKDTRMAELSTMNTTAGGESIEIIGTLKMQGHPVLEAVFDNWITQTEYHPVLRGNEIKEYYQLLRPQISFPEYPNDAVQYGYFFFFPEGGVYAWTEKELTEDELKIYRRFTSVLSLTYKRYKDLKDAEVRTREAVKQATLDRVRAEIASMRTKQDLDRITPLIWNELSILGIPFVRCGVFIMDDAHQQVHTFLSTPDGKALAAFHLDYTVSNLQKMISSWHDKQVYITHWGEKEFGELADTLVKQGSIASRDQYLITLPPEGIHLHLLPFVQGMLYVGNTTRFQPGDIDLLQSLADAFSTAYARYEDFKKLESAKQQVDQALVDLRQTQQQLVQSEKMASLGELTAGIAHEIQNPLNFVNNFSEVSNELIDEMVEEVKKGNFDDAKSIANDLKQNLEKINHHGKRADGIVKSMLQHSRASSGQKELTDINALCDEYLRLSYHGLRAKDKTFNAKFETDFDTTLEKINVIPQDIGRVILNLINNAFYAVTEKRKTILDGYEPKVLIRTKKLSDKVEIKVKDNGSGIPKKVLDKIFQPFFTTKPTGQGTGLGLSLAYDIITKGHGGELKVETKEGEGSEFVIQVPIKDG